MKKFILLMIIMLLTVTSVAAVTESGNYVRTTLLSQVPDRVEPGNYVDIRVKIENVQASTVEDLEVQLLPEYPFSLDSGEPALKRYGTVGGGNYGEDAIIAKWRVRVDENAVEGDNDLKIRYRVAGNEWVQPSPLQVSVKTVDAILNVKSISTIPERPSQGEEFTLNIELENQADTFFRNLKLTLDSDTVIPLASTNEKRLKIIQAGESENVSFDLITKGDADSVIYTLPLEIVYYDNEGSAFTKNVSFGMVITQEPKLITNVDSSEIVTTGQRGEVSLSISNLGVDEVKFVTVTMQDTDEYEVLGNREIYLGNIDSDDFETATYQVYMTGNAQNVPLVATLTYQDGLNREYMQEVTLALPLYTRSEAAKLGLVPRGNPVTAYIGFSILLFVAVFWFAMFKDLRGRKRMDKNAKTIWTVLLILTTVLGAIVYYFMVKRKADD